MKKKLTLISLGFILGIIASISFELYSSKQAELLQDLALRDVYGEHTVSLSKGTLLKQDKFDSGRCILSFHCSTDKVRPTETPKEVEYVDWTVDKK